MNRRIKTFLSLGLVLSLLLVPVPGKKSAALALMPPDKEKEKLLSLNKWSISLDAGESFQLTANVGIPGKDGNDVKWRSSDPVIAEVDNNGRVTAWEKDGYVYVTASLGSITATCTVSVSSGKDDEVKWKDIPVHTVLGKPAEQYNVFRLTSDARSKGRIKLSWARQKKVKRYELQRAKAGSGKYKTIAKRRKTGYTDKKVKAGSQYQYRVCAVRTDGTKRYSSAVKIRASFSGGSVGLDRPSHLQAELCKSNVVGIWWDKAEGADGYCIYRRDEDDAKAKPVKMIYGNKKTEWLDWNRELYHVYEYRVAAFRNIRGKRIYSKKSYPVTLRTYKGSYTRLVNVSQVQIELKGQDGKRKEINLKSRMPAKAVLEPDYSTYSNKERVVSDKIVWSSSDESILKVDKKGMITSGTKEGYATIYARAHNGIRKGVRIKVVNFANPSGFPKYKGELNNINRLLTAYRSEVRDIATYFTIYGKKDESGLIRLNLDYLHERKVYGIPYLEKISLVEDRMQKLVMEFPLLLEISYDHKEVTFRIQYSNMYTKVIYSKEDRFDRSSERMAPHWKYYYFRPI